MIKNIKQNLNEILLAYYIFSYILLGRIIPNYTEISTNVLLINLILIFIISLIYNRLKIKICIQELIVYCTIAILAFIDIVFRFNSYTIQTYEYVIIFAIVPIYLFLNIKNINMFFKAYSFFAILTAILYLADPFNDYKYSKDYMEFGYSVMMLAYIGIYIEAREKKGKIGIILKILTGLLFVELLIFGNKGAILAVGIFTLLYEIFVKTSTLKKITIIVVGIVLMLNYNIAIETIYNIAMDNDINSYSLKTLYRMTEDVVTGLTGRDRIWLDAYEVAGKNIIWGNGAGYYRENHNGLYTHNIIFDIFIEYGILVFAILTAVIIKGVLKIKKSKGKERLLGIVLLTMWFPMLIFSSNLQSNMGFWMFIIWTLVDKKYFYTEETNNTKIQYIDNAHPELKCSINKIIGK